MPYSVVEKEMKCHSEKKEEGKKWKKGRTE